MGQKIRSWRVNRRSDMTLGDLARMMNPIVQGWINFYGRFYKSMLYPVLRHINDYLVRWAMRKYKGLHRHANPAPGTLHQPGIIGGLYKHLLGNVQCPLQSAAAENLRRLHSP